MTARSDSSIVIPDLRQSEHVAVTRSDDPLIPAQAGIQHRVCTFRDGPRWVPAFAGTSGVHDQKANSA